MPCVGSGRRGVPVLFGRGTSGKNIQAGMGQMAEQNVSVDRLRVGVFIRLDLKWYQHPFFFNSFRISSDGQIDTLKKLGITRVSFDPSRSHCEPLEASGSAAGQQGREGLGPTGVQTSKSPVMGDKERRIRSYLTRRRKFQKCEKEFQETFVRVRSVMQRLVTGSREAVEEAGRLVAGMVDSLLEEKEVVINLMNVKSSDENVFYHSLNVAVLAMILGREGNLSSRELQELGLGALLHDVGKSRISKKHLYKRGRLTPAEEELVRRHPRYGVEMARSVEGVSPVALEIIGQHHERPDGRGYPGGLKGDAISPLASMTALCNVYDNLCNPLDPEKVLTPHEALSRLYGQEGFLFPKNLVELFVRCVGVYPPGTLVELTGGRMAMVMSHNLRDALRPEVLIHDPAVPVREAAIVELEKERGIHILRSVRPRELSAEAFNYLTPRSRLCYYFQWNGKGPGPSPARSGATR